MLGFGWELIANLRGKIKYVNKILTFLFFVFLSVNIHSQESIQGMLNFDDCSDLVISGEAVVYRGDDLFSLINGGAELYHEYGFVEVAVTEHLLPDSGTIKAELYNMGDSKGAWGIFSMTSTGKSHLLEIGDAARQGDGFLQFIKGQYMVYIYGSPAEETYMQLKAYCMAKDMLESAGPPRLMNAVKAVEREAEKLFYFKGNLGLQNIYNFHYKDVFNYEEGAAAVFNDMTALILNYKNEAECLENYDIARAFFFNSKKYHDQASQQGSFHMKDRKERVIECYFEKSFLVLFISSGNIDVKDFRESITDAMDIY